MEPLVQSERCALPGLFALDADLLRKRPGGPRSDAPRLPASRDDGSARFLSTEQASSSPMRKKVSGFPRRNGSGPFWDERRPKFKLDAANPHTFGSFVLPENYTELCGKILEDLKKIPAEFNALGKRFGSLFSRAYQAIEPYRCEDGPETLLMTMGADATVFKAAVDTLREKGEKVGLLKLVLFNPFPREDFLKCDSSLQGADRPRPQFCGPRGRPVQGSQGEPLRPRSKAAGSIGIRAGLGRKGCEPKNGPRHGEGGPQDQGNVEPVDRSEKGAVSVSK